MGVVSKIFQFQVKMEKIITPPLRSQQTQVYSNCALNKRVQYSRRPFESCDEYSSGRWQCSEQVSVARLALVLKSRNPPPVTVNDGELRATSKLIIIKI